MSTNLIEKIFDPNNVESAKTAGEDMYTIRRDNPKQGHYFGTGYIFDFYKKMVPKPLRQGSI
jgi:hypothetical protein